VGGACSTHRGDKKYTILMENGKRNLEDLGIDSRILLKVDLTEIQSSMDWIHLAQYRNQWQLF
jgi:hypothetical protein